MDTITVLLLIGILVVSIITYILGKKKGISQNNKYWEDKLPDLRKDAIAKSRAVIGGQFSENLAPYLPNFNYLPTECKFLGKPTDFIVFKGMDNKNIEEIVFVEVKSGKAKLSPQEMNLKKIIQNKKVRFEEYRIPEELTKSKE